MHKTDEGKPLQFKVVFKKCFNLQYALCI